MPIENYQDLVERVSAWLVRGDLKVQVPDFIQLAEAGMSRDLRIREQELTIDGAFIVGQDYLDLPLDCLWPRHVRILSSPVTTLEVLSPDQFSKRSDQEQTGAALNPAYAMVQGDRILLGRAPSAATAYKLLYHAGLPGLSDQRTTNQALRFAPDVYLYGSLLHAAPYLGTDERIAVWRDFYREAANSFRMMNWNARAAGAPLQMRPDFQARDRHTTWGR